MTIVDSGKSTYSGDTSTTSYSTPSADGSVAFSTESSINFSKRGSNFSKRERDIIENEASFSTLSPSKDRAKNKTVEDFTVNKLRYSSLGLHGRDKEKEILNTCLEKVTAKDDNIKRALVLIKGFSGTGKTALASFLIVPIQRRKGLYVKGKFDLYLRDQPYAGIAAACREICGEILYLRNQPAQGSGNGRSFQDIHDKLIDGLGGDIHLLTTMVPELNEIVGDQHTRFEPDGAAAGNHGNQEEAKARFNFIFRVFIRLITSYFAPLVMVLDDLQWADVGSLELIENLITDRDNSNFMIIGTYRSNEVDDTHLVSKVLRDLKEKSEQGDFDISEIEVGNLGVDEVDCVIMDLLSLDDSSKTIGLAEICLKRTAGNVFFLIAFIAMLQEEGLLVFNLGLFQWKWDVTKIESDTGASSNVVDLMKRKMTKPPKAFGQVLSMAACLGSSFDGARLGLVWSQYRDQSAKDNIEQDEKTLEEWLSLAVQEGLLERVGSSNYQWSHDKVQEAAFSLVPAEELNDFKFQVGDILLRQLSEKELYASIFVVVNLLQEGSLGGALCNLKRIRLAELNLRACQKAATFSAFSSAGNFARMGIELLPGDRWTSHCALSLDLYSTAAESNGYLGNIESMESLCSEVLKQDIPLLDKLRVYNVLVSNNSKSGRNAEAVVLLLKILRQLGCKFPKSSVSRSLATVASLAKAQATLKSRTPEEIAKMPIMTDRLQIETSKLLGKLTICAYQCGSDLKSLAILPTMKNIRLTLRYGVCEESPIAFAMLGVVLSGFLGDLQAGSMIGDYTLLLLTKLESKRTYSRTMLIVSYFVFSWTRPLRSLLKSFLDGYENGLKSGDTESAMFVSVWEFNKARRGDATPRLYTHQFSFACSALPSTLFFRFFQECLSSCLRLIAPFTASK
jgi:predicted ATPase